jgi:hypothetical protein
LSDLSVELLAATIPEPTEAQIVWAEKQKKPDAVERYYQSCMRSTGKNRGKGYCAAVAWSIYCKYKKPDSPHCRRKRSDYLTGR